MYIQPRRLIAGLSSLLLALSYAGPGSAQLLEGAARAVDGDTLEIDGQRVRLYGIDAPESDQTCQRDGTNWPCGQIAAQQLSALVKGQQVVCNSKGTDHFGRILAVCSAGPEGLNAVMVEQGWALAYRQYSDDYAAAELSAKNNRLGVWSSTFTLPSDYRHSKQPLALKSAPAKDRHVRVQPRLQSGRCLIKGNRNRRGEWIYHLPGMPYYEQTRAEEIFCTEDQALRAGYRRAKVQ